MERRQAQKWLKRMQEVWDRAKTGIEQAQARQRSQANRHRREEDFGVGDYVMITTKNWDLRRPLGS